MELRTVLAICKARTRPLLAYIIHERFYCNRRYAAATRLAATCSDQPGGLAPHGLNILFQVCLGLSGLRAPVSLGVLAVSSRSVMNNVGLRAETQATMAAQVVGLTLPTGRTSPPTHRAGRFRSATAETQDPMVDSGS